MEEEKSEDKFFDEWEPELLDALIRTEEQVVQSSLATTKPSSSNSFPLSNAFPPPPPPPPPSAALSYFHAASFSPPRELSQRPTRVHSPPPVPVPVPNPDKDIEIDRLKRELEHATKQIANLEKERVKLKKERDKKEDQLKLISSRIEEENACTKCSNLKNINKDFGNAAPDCHKISSKFQNSASSNNPIVETTFKATGGETDLVIHPEAQGALSADLPAYLNLSQKLLAIWGSPTDKKMGNNAISKLLAGCQQDFHILLGCMNMSLPTEITRERLSDLSSSDCFHSPEAQKMSNLYLALVKIADGTNALETLIDPLLDLSGMKNVVIVHSSLCILHMLLKLLLELEKNVGTSALCSGTMSSLKDFALGGTMLILV